MNKLIEQVLETVRASYPKSQTQEEHNLNMKIVEDAVEEIKLGLKEELTNLIKQMREEELPNAIDEDGNPVRIWLS